MGIFKLLNCISWLIIPTVQLYTGNCLLQLPGCCRSVVPLHQRAQSLNPKAVVKILLGVLKAASFHVPFDNVLDVAGMILFAVLRTGRSLNGCPVMWSRRWCCHEWPWNGARSMCAQGHGLWSKGGTEHSLLPQACLVSQPQAAEIISWDLSAVSRGSTATSFSFSLFQMMTALGLVICIYITVSALLQILYFLNSL